MNILKRKIIVDLAVSWALFIGLFVIIAVEQNLDYPYNRITNASWVICAVGLVFFVVRGFCRLSKYIGFRR